MKPAAVASVVAFLASAWMAVHVAGNYGGEISGLFHTGAETPIPPEVAAHTRRAADQGYDGQFYHLMTHDPLLRQGYQRYVDNPRLRWRRIGLPAAAWLLRPAPDAAYVAIELAFAALGAWWLARYAAVLGASPAWGLLFLLIPAVAVSLDRMTVDLPLAALGVGVLLHAEDRRVFPILAAAALVRETGVVLIAAWCLWSILQRRPARAATGATCAVPALAWWVYVHAHTSPDGTRWLSAYPFSGLIERTLSGSGTPTGGHWLAVASFTEEISNAGLWLAIVLTAFLLLRRRAGLPEMIALVFTLFASTLGRDDIWTSAYAAGRTLSPLLVALSAVALRDRKLVFACPLLLMLPRIALQYQAETAGALRKLL